jgi:hypothetical protein
MMNLDEAHNEALNDDLPDLITRLPDESAQAYHALCTYAQLGPDRSLAATCQREGKSRAVIERWSSKHAWVARVKAFDAYVASASQASYVETSAAIAKDHAHEAANLRARALARLRDVPLDNLPPAIALKLWVEAIRIERLSLGLPTENTHATAQVQASVQATVEETRARDAETLALIHDPKARELATQLFDQLMYSAYPEIFTPLDEGSNTSYIDEELDDKMNALDDANDANEGEDQDDDDDDDDKD